MDTKVFAAINAVQRELASTGISKDRNNSQQGYKFRGIDDMYNAIGPLLAKHNLLILPAFSERAVTERVTKNGGALFYVTVTGRFNFVSTEDGSQYNVGPFYGEAMDSGDKATNKAMSASYKYMAMEVFCIPTDADNDADATTHDVAARIVAAKVSPMQEHIDAFAALPKETQDVIKEHAATLIHLCKDGGDMVGYIREQEYDDEAKLALWTQLPSNVRSAYKQQQQVQALKKAAPALASQGD